MNITDPCLHLATSAQAMAVHAPSRGADDRGQTTAEYALVLLGAASIAMLIVAWTVRSDSIGSLLDAVLGTVVDKLK